MILPYRYGFIVKPCVVFLKFTSDPDQSIYITLFIYRLVPKYFFRPFFLWTCFYFYIETKSLTYFESIDQRRIYITKTQRDTCLASLSRARTQDIIAICDISINQWLRTRWSGSTKRSTPSKSEGPRGRKSERSTLTGLKPSWLLAILLKKL